MTDSRGELIEPVRGISGKAELIGFLESWLKDSDSDRLGVTGSRFGGWGAVTGDLGGRAFRLNADTTRNAIIKAVDTNLPNLQAWRVVPTQSGKIAKVIPYDSDDLPGWYCYLLKPLPEAESI